MTLLEDRVKRKYKMMRQQKRSTELVERYKCRPTMNIDEIRRKFAQVNTDKT